MRLVGLDFETANTTFGSICAAGCAVLEDGEVVEKQEWLIRPHRRVDRMLGMCFAVHGISWYDLRDVPEFPAIWPVLRRMLTSGGVVVAHNTAFDITHLKGVLEIYGLASVEFNYVCSLRVSRQLLPELESHSLDAVAAHFGHKFHHHDALEDAIACATIIHHLGIPENSIRRFDYCPASV